MTKIIGNESKTVLKNILISVITTVTGAFVVYNLGFTNKSSGPTKLEKEERTIQSWKTLVAIDNIYGKATLSLLMDAMKLGNFSEASLESEKEQTKFLNSLQDLIDVEGIDKDLKALMQRRKADEEAGLPVTKAYYAMFDNLMQKAIDESWEDQRLLDSLLRGMQEYSEKSKGLTERFITEIETLTSILSERYDYNFDIDELMIVQIIKHKKDPYEILKEDGKSLVRGNKKVKDLGFIDEMDDPESYFHGEWNVNGGAIEFTPAGEMNWNAGTLEKVSGEWKLDSNHLVLNVKNPTTGKPDQWKFKLTFVEKSSFSMILNRDPYNYYSLERKKK